MRKAYSQQQRLDCPAVQQVPLNLHCRDEIIPVLRGLQHIYGTPTLRQEILKLVADDVQRGLRHDRGREGLDHWQVLVLAGVRLGCNLDYDKLQDLAEQHRALRHVMGLGDWTDPVDFSWRRIRDNVCLLQPTTIEKISHALVAAGHALVPDAAQKIRVDSFVMETNIHYPTESSLIHDGVRKIIEWSVALADELHLPGWRQHQHLLKKITQITREIGRIAARKGPNYQLRWEKQYRRLLTHTGRILRRAQNLRDQALALPAAELDVALRTASIQHFVQLTQQVCGTARRRVLLGETVPNADKLFSLFEPHTQLHQRGKAGEPVQFGRLVLVYEDAAGFLVHQHLLDRTAQDVDVPVEQTRILQARLKNRVAEISFDCGFHSPTNQTELAQIVPLVCLPKKGKHQAAAQNASATETFRQARRRHAGIEAAIGALQASNGLQRCRDKTDLGLKRYLSLGVFGRNLHTLGKLLIARDHPSAAAASSQRQAA